jgi:hypothetical protein
MENDLPAQKTSSPQHVVTLRANGIKSKFPRRIERLSNVLRASSAKLAMNQQGNGLALAARYETGFDRQFKSAMRDLEFPAKSSAAQPPDSPRSHDHE